MEIAAAISYMYFYKIVTFILTQNPLRDKPAQGADHMSTPQSGRNVSQQSSNMHSSGATACQAEALWHSHVSLEWHIIKNQMEMQLETVKSSGQPLLVKRKRTSGHYMLT